MWVKENITKTHHWLQTVIVPVLTLLIHICIMFRFMQKKVCHFLWEIPCLDWWQGYVGNICLSRERNIRTWILFHHVSMPDGSWTNISLSVAVGESLKSFPLSIPCTPNRNTGTYRHSVFPIITMNHLISITASPTHYCTMRIYAGNGIRIRNWALTSI